MPKFFKRAAAMLMAATIVTGTVPAMAGNIDDTGYSFTFRNATNFTEMREKNDDTSMYMSCQSVSRAGVSYTAHAVGSATVGGTKNDCSAGVYTFYAGTTRYIANYVNEWGYRYGGIAAAPNYSYAYTASGVWSPDSV